MDSFYDLEGNEISRKSLVELMINYFRELVETEDTKITDFNEGSEIRNLMESIAVDLYHLEYVTYNQMKMAFLKYATGQWLDLHGEKYGLSRDYGSYSYGNLKFTLPKPLTYPLVIPYGTICVHNETGALFKTTLDCTIPTGDTSAEVLSVSCVIGKLMNVDPETITLFQDNPPYTTLTVTNPEKFNGGRDLETDDEYRQRLLDFKKQDTFGSNSYYKALALTIEGVHDIEFADAPSDEYTATILVNGDNKPTPTDIMERATALFTLKDNIVLNHNFYISKPTYIAAILTVRVYVEETVDKQEFIKCLNAVFDGGEYENITYYGVNIGQDLTKLDLIMALETIQNVSQVDYILQGENKTTFDTIDVNQGEVIYLDTEKLQIIQEVE